MTIWAHVDEEDWYRSSSPAPTLLPVSHFVNFFYRCLQSSCHLLFVSWFVARPFVMSKFGDSEAEEDSLDESLSEKSDDDEDEDEEEGEEEEQADDENDIINDEVEESAGEEEQGHHGHHHRKRRKGRKAN